MLIEKEKFDTPLDDYKLLHFEDAFPDGRLTEPSDGKSYRLRDAIKRVEELGRPLTPEEFKEFEIK